MLSDKYNVYTREQLSVMCTRRLLKHLNETRCWGNQYWNYDPEETKEIKEYVTMLKSILATREHIPSKKESKQLRIARIKKGV